MVFEDMASKYFFCLTSGMTRARSCWPSTWHNENRFANLVHTSFEISVWVIEIKRISIHFSMMQFCFTLCHLMLQTPNEGTYKSKNYLMFGPNVTNILVWGVILGHALLAIFLSLIRSLINQIFTGLVIYKIINQRNEFHILWKQQTII